MEGLIGIALLVFLLTGPICAVSLLIEPRISNPPSLRTKRYFKLVKVLWVVSAIVGAIGIAVVHTYGVGLHKFELAPDTARMYAFVAFLSWISPLWFNTTWERFLALFVGAAIVSSLSHPPMSGPQVGIVVSAFLLMGLMQAVHWVIYAPKQAEK